MLLAVCRVLQDSGRWATVLRQVLLFRTDLICKHQSDPIFQSCSELPVFQKNCWTPKRGGSVFPTNCQLSKGIVGKQDTHAGTPWTGVYIILHNNNYATFLKDEDVLVDLV